MKKFKGLCSVFVPALLLASACFICPPEEAAAFVVDTPNVLKEQEAQPLYRPEPSAYLAFAVKMKGLGNIEEARRALLEARAFFAGTVWEKKANLLLGLMALDEGSREAASHFEEAAGIEVIDDYIVFFQAEALFRSGRFTEAAGAYGFVLSAYPATALKERASFRKGEALFASGAFEEAALALTRFLTAWPKSHFVAEANSLLAKSYLASGFDEEAVAPLKNVSAGYPSSPFAAEADKLLSSFVAEGLEEAAFSDEDRFRRSENYFYTADYGRAIVGYSSLLTVQEFSDRARFRTAIAFARLKRYKESERALRDYLSLKKPAREAEALYWLAQVSMKQGRQDGVFESERRLSAKYRDSDERARVLMMIARLNDGKDPEAADRAYKTVIDEFSASLSSEEALWNIGWEAYSSGEMDEAYENFSRYLDERPRGRLVTQFLYWKARSAERLGKEDEARALFDRVCGTAPRSFYCLMAGLREQGPAQIAEAAASGTLPPDEELAQDPALERESAFKGEARYLAATELLFLGLHEQASSEIDLLARGHKRDKAGLAELAGLFYDAKDFYRAFRIYRTHLLNSGDASHIHLGYPMKLVETIKEKAVAGSADPFLVAAVMREESHFNPRAVSYVGALGLMQIMPSTGSQIAKDLGEGFTKGRLLEPETSMRYGGWYLGQILRRFDGDAVLAVAGYNAGPNAAARWAATLPYDTDEFVESIPYEETRGYVKRVLSSYAEFLKLGKEEFEERVTRVAPDNGPKFIKEADAKNF